MFTARKKIVKEKGAEPDEFEESVAQVCVIPSALGPVRSLTVGALGAVDGWGRAATAPRELRTHALPCPQALFDLEATNQELKADLRDLYITSAKEVDISGAARKAIIVHVSAMLAGAGGRGSWPG